MHHVTRRLSPSLIVAIVALFAALAGTAFAAGDILIDNPDQLASNVVTQPKIAPNSITSGKVIEGAIRDNDLHDPQLKVRVLPDGAVFPDGDATVRRTGVGTYDVTFNTSSLNAQPDGSQPNTLLNNNCAFATAVQDKVVLASIGRPTPGAPNTVHVSTVGAAPDQFGLLRAADAGFDLLASC